MGLGLIIRVCYVYTWNGKRHITNSLLSAFFLFLQLLRSAKIWQLKSNLVDLGWLKALIIHFNFAVVRVSKVKNVKILIYFIHVNLINSRYASNYQLNCNFMEGMIRFFGHTNDTWMWSACITFLYNYSDGLLLEFLVFMYIACFHTFGCSVV